MQVEHLPVAIEEVIRLGITDHIVTAFVAGQKPSIMFITNNGKAVNRDTKWLEPATSFRSKGQSLLSKERREAGIRIIGITTVDSDDWGVFLQGDGALTIHKLSELLAVGSIPSGGQSPQILSFSGFHLQDVKR
jgi:hypothetical protein